MIIDKIDLVYFCLRSFLLRTPSRDSAGDGAVAIMGLMVGVAVATALVLLSVFFSLFYEWLDRLKVVIVASTFGAGLLVFWMYEWKERGKSVVMRYSTKLPEKRAAVIGGALSFFGLAGWPIVFSIIMMRFS